MSISIELLISLRQHGESHFELVLTESCSGETIVGVMVLGFEGGVPAIIRVYSKAPV